MTAKITAFQPAHDQILVEHIASGEETTAGGLVLPGQAPDQLARGTVVSYGPGKLTPEGKRAPMDVHVGEVIVYPGGSYRDIDVNGRKLRLVSAAAVLGVIR